MTTSHQGIKHNVQCNGKQSKIAYVRWAPSANATQTITDAQGVSSVTRTSAGLYVINFVGSPEVIVPMGASFIEDDSTVRHTVRVKSTSTTVGACTATVDHKISTFATESSFVSVPCQQMPAVADAGGATGTSYSVAPCAGTVTKIYSVLGGTVNADAVVTCSINGTPITNGVITVANASARGEIDSCTPTAANTVAAGDTLLATSDGGGSAPGTLDLIWVIQGTGATPTASDTVDELAFTFLLVGGNL